MAKREKRIKNVRVECDVPTHILQYGPHPYGSAEYWKWADKKIKEWVREFHEFIRDHRSQDPVSLTPVFDTEEVCSECGDSWDVSLWVDEGNDGLLHCNCCGAIIDQTTSKEVS